MCKVTAVVLHGVVSKVTPVILHEVVSPANLASGVAEGPVFGAPLEDSFQRHSQQSKDVVGAIAGRNPKLIRSITCWYRYKTLLWGATPGDTNPCVKSLGSSYTGLHPRDPSRTTTPAGLLVCDHAGLVTNKFPNDLAGGVAEGRVFGALLEDSFQRGVASKPRPCTPSHPNDFTAPECKA